MRVYVCSMGILAPSWSSLGLRYGFLTEKSSRLHYFYQTDVTEQPNESIDVAGVRFPLCERIAPRIWSCRPRTDVYDFVYCALYTPIGLAPLVAGDSAGCRDVVFYPIAGK